MYSLQRSLQPPLRMCTWGWHRCRHSNYSAPKCDIQAGIAAGASVWAATGPEPRASCLLNHPWQMNSGSRGAQAIHASHHPKKCVSSYAIYSRYLLQWSADILLGALAAAHSQVGVGLVRTAGLAMYSYQHHKSPGRLQSLYYLRFSCPLSVCTHTIGGEKTRNRQRMHLCACSTAARTSAVSRTGTAPELMV
jgi:hypothetical protein